MEKHKLVIGNVPVMTKTTVHNVTSFIKKRQEKDIDDALSRIKWEHSITDFIKTYKSTFMQVDSSLKPTFWNIVNTYILYQIQNNAFVKKRKITRKKLSAKRLKKSLKLFFKPYNEKKMVYDVAKTFRFGNNLIAHISKIGGSDTQLKVKTRRNQYNVIKFSSVYVDMDNELLYIYNADRHLVHKFFGWFNSKLRLKLVPLTQEQYTPLDVKKYLLGPNISLYEIGLRHTVFSISDKIRISSRKGEAKIYLDKLKILLDDKDISIYDLSHVRMSYKTGNPVTVYFERKTTDSENINVLLTASGKQISDLPPIIQDFIKKEILLYDKLDEEMMVKVVIHKQLVSKSEYHNPNFRKYLEALEKLRLIKCKPVYRYHCQNSDCQYRLLMGMSTNTCQCGKVTKKKHTDYYDIEINYNKIMRMLGKGVRQSGYSYKAMPEEYMGFKDASIVRFSKDNKYYYILLNKKGLLPKKFDDLRLIGLPFILVNLKGEIASTVGSFHTLNSYELVHSLINKDYSCLRSILENIKDNALELEIFAFKECYKRLNSKSSLAPREFEDIVFGLFNVIFPNSQKLGGPSLPDGAFGIKYTRMKYGLWDAKRYDKTALQSYVKKKGLKKDLEYMKNFTKHKIIARFGGLSHYIFVTSNTSKADFLKASAELDLQIASVKANLGLKKCRVACINGDEFIKLAKFYSQNLSLLVNNVAAGKIVRESLNKNDGYFLFNNVKGELIKLISEAFVLPEPVDLRKNAQDKIK